jgi:hypothetical protein
MFSLFFLYNLKVVRAESDQASMPVCYLTETAAYQHEVLPCETASIEPVWFHREKKTFKKSFHGILKIDRASNITGSPFL